jgi:predicted DNA-binding protein with PD1-like motif
LTRTIRQPGPPNAERIAAIPVATTPIDTVLPAGTRFLDALATLLGGPIDSACLTLRAGAFGPFAYVIPSLPPDATHAAYYSDTRRPPGRSVIETGAITLGTRDGKPFFHCHALWTEANGTRACGHVLPDDTMIAVPIHITGVGITGARFEVHPDPETGFSLFTPRATTTPRPGVGQGIALRLAPNQELSHTLEQIGRTAGFRRATVHGGVASIIEARFTDAPDITGYATELAVIGASVRCMPDAGPPTAIDVAIVDYTNDIRTGRLVNDDNPVLMTFEGVLVERSE